MCAGSPFRPKVVSARRVHVVGGWESILDGNNQMKLKLNEMKTVEFDTRGAGPGTFLSSCGFSFVKTRKLEAWFSVQCSSCLRLVENGS